MRPATFALALVLASIQPSQASAGMVEVSGTVTDMLDGSAIERASLKVPGLARARSDEGGGYRLVFESDEEFEKLVVKKANHFPRVAWVGGEPVQSRDLDLLPKKRGFNLEQFDLLFRVGWQTVDGTRVSPRSEATFRWTAKPRFAVASRWVDCGPGGLDEDCRFEEKVPGHVYRRAKQLIRKNAPLLSGGFVAKAQIGRRSVAQGRAYPRSDSSLVRDGEILIVLGDFSGMAWARLRESGVMRAAAVNTRMLDGPALDERSFIHELAHSLGFSHPLGYRIFPRPTIMGNCQTDPDVPSDDDVLHAWVLYHRPPGSTTPDSDPRPAASRSTVRSGSKIKVWDGCGLDRTERSALAVDSKASPLLVSGTVRPASDACAGSLGRPCRVHTLEVERAGEASLTLTWDNSATDLDFQLYRAGSPLMISHRRNGCVPSRPAGRQRERFDVEPGSYELRVIHWAGERSVDYEVGGDLP